MANQPFERENRYIVVKIDDMYRALSLDQVSVLKNLLSIVESSREARGKGKFVSVVVEHDWPEYEPVWEMIEARMTSQQNAKDDDGR